MQGVVSWVVSWIKSVLQGAYNLAESGERYVDTTGDMLLLTAFLAAVLFVLIYGHYADWRGSRFGNHLIKFMQVAMLALGLGVVRIFWDEFPLFAYVRAITMLALNWVLWWRVWIVLEEQGVVTTSKTQQHRDEKREDSRVALRLLDDQQEERDEISRQSDSEASH